MTFIKAVLRAPQAKAAKTTVGIIGLGYIGKVHLDAYRQIPGVVIGGIATRRPDPWVSLADELGAAIYGDARALLDDAGIDAVSVTVPTYLHREFTLAALEAGKHVLIEKPLALTAEDSGEIARAAWASDRTVAVGHVVRHWPAYRAVARLVLGGELGKPQSAYATRLSATPTWSAWLRDPQLSGGGVHDFHIHDLDVLNWLFGEPVAVRAWGRRGETGGWDEVTSFVEYEGVHSGVLAEANGSIALPAGYPFTTVLRVVCDRGTVELVQRLGGKGIDSGSAFGSAVQVYPRDGARSFSVEFGRGDPYVEELTDFVAAVRSGERRFETVVAADLAVRTALAARQSLDTGEVAPVEPSSIEGGPGKSGLVGDGRGRGGGPVRWKS